MRNSVGKALGMCAGGLLHLAHRGHRWPDIGRGGQIGLVRSDQLVKVFAEVLISGVQPRRNSVYERRNGFVLVLKFT